MTRGRAAVPDPFDLSAVRRSDELFDALSARRPADVASDMDDPAVRLLAGLAADVDAGAPPLPAPARVACSGQGRHRRGVGAIVSFGVAALVLTSAGAAAAGGGGGIGDTGAVGREVRPPVSERSNTIHRQHDSAPGPAAGDRGSPGAPAEHSEKDSKDSKGPVAPSWAHDPRNPRSAHRPPSFQSAGTADPRWGGKRSGDDRSGTDGPGDESGEGPVWGPSPAGSEPRPEDEPRGRSGRQRPHRPSRSEHSSSQHGDHRAGVPSGGDGERAAVTGDDVRRSAPEGASAQPE